MIKFFVSPATGEIFGRVCEGGSEDQIGRIPAWLTAIGIGPDTTKPQEIIPNSIDASHEKHLPVVSVDGNIVTVKVSSEAHPMTPEHYIQWMYLETKKGGQYRALNPGDVPEAKFALVDGDKPIAAYAYCNLHWLWKSSV